jgi:cytoskeleton protein RodZ
LPGAPPAPPAGATTTSLPNPVAATPAAPAPGDRELVLSFRDHSWTEVRERNGRVLLSAMMSPGARQTLSGQGPFDLVIGNAADVSITLDGKPVDLAPHIRQSVARLTLQ